MVRTCDVWIDWATSPAISKELGMILDDCETSRKGTAGCGGTVSFFFLSSSVWLVAFPVRDINKCNRDRIDFGRCMTRVVMALMEIPDSTAYHIGPYLNQRLRILYLIGLDCPLRKNRTTQSLHFSLLPLNKCSRRSPLNAHTLAPSQHVVYAYGKSGLKLGARYKSRAGSESVMTSLTRAGST